MRLYLVPVLLHTKTKFLEKSLIKITTSIDAGTPETFKKVRGRPKFYNELMKALAFKK